MPGALNVCSFVFAVDVHHVLFIGHDAASHALYSGVPYVFVVLHGKIHQVSHFTLACVLPTYKASTLCDYHCKPVLSDVWKWSSKVLQIFSDATWYCHNEICTLYSDSTEWIDEINNSKNFNFGMFAWASRLLFFHQILLEKCKGISSEKAKAGAAFHVHTANKGQACNSYKGFTSTPG